MPGETLADHLRSRLSIRETLLITRQIAEALEAAHERGIVHRDLKPANVMITPEGRVKLLDLGLAKIVESVRSDAGGFSRETTAVADETRPGVILGTVEFMSPEQARGKTIDKRTDIWAFGCIVFECLSGRRAFSGESVPDALAAILRSEPEWERLPPETPAALRELLARCLQKDAGQRLRDIGDARLAIDELLAEFDPRRSTPSGAKLAPKRNRFSRAALFAAALIVILTSAVVFILRSSRLNVPSRPRLLAILPFRDLSNLRDDSLLGEGLVETVSSAVVNTTGLQVVSPAAAVAASTTESDPLRVARNLGATLLLRGAVQRNGDRVRITYSLWDVGRKSEISGGTLDGSASDLFELQDRLVARLSDAESLPATGRTPPASGLASADDQEGYLKAVGLLQHYNTRTAVDEAAAILERLSVAAPRSPYVFASLARAYLENFDLTHDPTAVLKAEDAAKHARELGPALTEVDITVGELRLHSGNAAGAIEAFRQALATSPTSFEARLGLARALGAAKNDAEAEKTFRQAIDLQPTYWGGYSKFAGFYYARGRYGEAAAAFRRVTELTPDSATALSNLGGAYYLAGDFEKALAAFQRSLALQPTAFAQSNIGTAEFFLGHYRSIRGRLRKGDPARARPLSRLVESGRRPPLDSGTGGGLPASLFALDRPLSEGARAQRRRRIGALDSGELAREKRQTSGSARRNRARPGSRPRQSRRRLSGRRRPHDLPRSVRRDRGSSPCGTIRLSPRACGERSGICRSSRGQEVPGCIPVGEERSALEKEEP